LFKYLLEVIEQCVRALVGSLQTDTFAQRSRVINDNALRLAVENVCKKLCIAARLLRTHNTRYFIIIRKVSR